MDLAALLAAWRTSRAIELAAAIERASMIAARGRAPITGHSQRALHEAWLAVERAKDPADIDRLMATLAHGNMNQVRERLAALSTREPDPRVAAGLEAMLAAPPSVAFVKSASSTMWTAVFAELARIADPRTRTIHERLPWLEHDRATSPFDAGKLRSRTAKAVAKVALAIAPAPPLTPELRAVCDAVAVGEPGDRGADLLAKIYDDPSDLAARAVYGDWLSEQADPRGELIALQLARGVYNDRFDTYRYRDRKGSQREQALLRTYQSVWSGPLGALFSDLTFELGFPYRGHVAPKVALSSLAIREAATLAHLVLHDPADVRLLARRPFHGLRSVAGLKWSGFEALATAPETPSIRAVRMHLYQNEAPLPEPAVLASPWPLERLELHAWTDRPSEQEVRAFMRTALVRRLHALRIGYGARNDPAYIAGFVETEIARLELDNFNSQFTLAVERDEDGDPRTRITIPFDTYAQNRASIVPLLRERAATWPRELVDTALVEIDARFCDVPPEREAVLAAAEAFAGELTISETQTPVLP